MKSNQRIETGEESDTPVLNIGKALTPKLFLEYSVGLLDPVSAIQLKYHIWDNWSWFTCSYDINNNNDKKI